MRFQVKPKVLEYFEKLMKELGVDDIVILDKYNMIEIPEDAAIRGIQNARSYLKTAIGKMAKKTAEKMLRKILVELFGTTKKKKKKKHNV
jgi:hypothetical protein